VEPGSGAASGDTSSDAGEDDFFFAPALSHAVKLVSAKEVREDGISASVDGAPPAEPSTSEPSAPAPPAAAPTSDALLPPAASLRASSPSMSWDPTPFVELRQSLPASEAPPKDSLWSDPPRPSERPRRSKRPGVSERPRVSEKPARSRRAAAPDDVPAHGPVPSESTSFLSAPPEEESPEQVRARLRAQSRVAASPARDVASAAVREPVVLRDIATPIARDEVVPSPRTAQVATATPIAREGHPEPSPNDPVDGASRASLGTEESFFAPQALPASRSWKGLLASALLATVIGTAGGAWIAQQKTGVVTRRIDSKVDVVRAAEERAESQLERQAAELVATRDALTRALAEESAKEEEARVALEERTDSRVKRVARDVSELAERTRQAQARTDARIYKMDEALKLIDWVTTEGLVRSPKSSLTKGAAP